MVGGIPYPIPTLPVPCATGATVLTWLKRKWGWADVSMALLLIKLYIELYIYLYNYIIYTWENDGK